MMTLSGRLTRSFETLRMFSGIVLLACYMKKPAARNHSLRVIWPSAEPPKGLLRRRGAIEAMHKCRHRKFSMWPDSPQRLLSEGEHKVRPYGCRRSVRTVCSGAFGLVAAGRSGLDELDGRFQLVPGVVGFVAILLELLDDGADVAADLGVFGLELL